MYIWATSACLASLGTNHESAFAQSTWEVMWISSPLSERPGFAFLYSGLAICTSCGDTQSFSSVVQINSLLSGLTASCFCSWASFEFRLSTRKSCCQVWHAGLEGTYQRATALSLLWNSAICITLTTACNFSLFSSLPSIMPTKR